MLCMLTGGSCTTRTGEVPHVPGPARSVTRGEAVRIAYSYTQVRWMPQKRHILHGPDRNGITVHTPDVSLNSLGLGKGWWQVGREAQGMPYQWGGFDTPETFSAHLGNGMRAGDVSTGEKRRLGDAAVSRDACGIDCSGFISRCWRMDHPVSTRDLPKICERLESWDQLRPGDILLNGQHVLLFASWKVPGREMLGYEAGPRPCWRVNSCGLRKDFLQTRGYAPWRYGKMKDRR